MEELGRMDAADNGIRQASKENGVQSVDPVSYTHLDVYKRQLLGAVLWAVSLYAQGPSVFVTLILAILLYFVLYYLEQGHPTVSFLPFKLTFLLPFTISFLTQIWYYLSAAS